MRRTAGRIALAVFAGVFVVAPPGATAAERRIEREADAAAPTLAGHRVVLDRDAKLLSWVSPQQEAYGEVVRLAWERLLTGPHAPSIAPIARSRSRRGGCAW